MLARLIYQVIDTMMVIVSTMVNFGDSENYGYCPDDMVDGDLRD